MKQTLRTTSGQLVFGRDMIFNIKHEANLVHEWKQQLIVKNKNAEMQNTFLTPIGGGRQGPHKERNRK